MQLRGPLCYVLAAVYIISIAKTCHSSQIRWNSSLPEDLFAQSLLSHRPFNCITRAAAKPAFMTQLRQSAPPLQPRLQCQVSRPRHYSQPYHSRGLLRPFSASRQSGWRNYDTPVMSWHPGCSAERAEWILNKQENSRASRGLSELYYRCIKGEPDAFFMTDIYFPFLFSFFLLW